MSEFDAYEHVIGRASDLETSPPEDEELGFSQDDTKYRGFPRSPEVTKPLHPKHDLKRGFYVRSTRERTHGYVPWPGSTIVWPWETGWEQDLKVDRVEPRTQEKRGERQ